MAPLDLDHGEVGPSSVPITLADRASVRHSASLDFVLVHDVIVRENVSFLSTIHPSPSCAPQGSPGPGNQRSD